MNRWVQTLLGSTAVAVAWTVPYEIAAAAPVLPPAQSYADLLEPIPNALQLQRANDAWLSQNAAAQIVPVRDHHHHHHHHHHNGFAFRLGAPYYAAPYYGPQCHWAWGRPYWDGYRWERPRIRVCN